MARVEPRVQARSPEPTDTLHAFRAPDEILALAEQSAGIGVWEVDLETGLLRGTPQFFRIMGLEAAPHPVPIETTRRLRYPGDQDRIFAGFTRAVAGGSDRFETEYRIIRP